MVKEIKYGLISDTHREPQLVPEAVNLLVKRGVDNLILNGDVGSGTDYIGFTLETAARTGLETFVQPGSHEGVEEFFQATFALRGNYPNLIDVFYSNKRASRRVSHDLVFMPGSDWCAQGGQHRLGLQNGVRTGSGRTEEGEPISFTSIDDLRTLVTAPDKTIVVCHVPRKFENGEHGIDMAYFAERSDGSLMPGIVVENMIRQQVGQDLPHARIEEIARANGFTFKRENRGNEDLRKIYEELGITKAISGHFHESGHRAHDSKGLLVEAGSYVDNLFWNSGCLDQGQFGILTVREDGKIKYENLTL